VAVPAAGWVVVDHPEITPPSNFHQLRDTTHVHDEMVKERGAEAVRQMRRTALSMINLQGAQRLVKVLPEIRDDPLMSPSAKLGLKFQVQRLI
jgi:hypothetical protein